MINEYRSALQGLLVLMTAVRTSGVSEEVQKELFSVAMQEIEKAKRNNPLDAAGLVGMNPGYRMAEAVAVEVRCVNGWGWN